MITTTISTVGYGDIKGFNSSEPEWANDMCYLIVVQFVGILLFTIVINDIFISKKVKTLNKIVSERIADLEVYLNDVSNVIKHRALSQEMVD